MESAEKINPWQRWAKKFWGIFPSFLLLELTLRYHSAGILGSDQLPTQSERVRAWISGGLSDIWMAILFSALLSFLPFPIQGVFATGLFKTPSRLTWQTPRAIDFLGLIAAAILGGFLSLLLPYVSFFGSLPTPHHATYLADGNFLKSSLDYLVDPLFLRAYIPFIIALIFGALGIFDGILFASRAASFRTALTVGVLVLGPCLQSTKVQLNSKKVGWKTPTPLRLNAAEYLFERWWMAPDHQPLTQAETQWLLKTQTPEALDLALGEALEGHAKGAETDFGLALKASVQKRLESKKITHVVLVLLESLRPEESSFFHPERGQPTLTPHWDGLAQSGVAFSNAWSAGNVTRSGQEASWCGLLTGPETSAMRTLVSLRPHCLPKALRERFGEGVQSAWWHGGDFNFDSQGSFWKRQSVDFMLSKEDFPKGTPETFWGISDFALVQKMLGTLESHFAEGAYVRLHLFLSISNHADWGLPPDAPSLGQSSADPHPSYATSRYTDAALGRLVEGLQSKRDPDGSSFWSNTLFVVANDHGLIAPSPLTPASAGGWGVSPGTDLILARASSQVGLVLTGGIVETLLKESGTVAPLMVTRPVSQVDIAPTVADLLGLRPLRTVGDSLFAHDRRWPVVVDLGEKVFFPKEADNAKHQVLGWVVPVEDFAKVYRLPEGSSRVEGEQGFPFDAEERALRFLFFRAWSERLENGLAGQVSSQ